MLRPEIDICSYVEGEISVEVTGRFVRWEHPRAIDASIKTGEQIHVIQSIHTYHDDKLIAKPEPHISEYFFQIGLFNVKYLFKDWAGNEASCGVLVDIYRGKIGLL